MTDKEAICHEYCKPCEWYGVCPNSYAEYDAEHNGKDKYEPFNKIYEEEE